MKLTYFQLEQHLKSKLAPIYVISGDEILLKNDLLRMIRKATKSAGYTQKQRFAPENQNDWESLYGELHLTSLFIEKSLIEIDLRQAKMTKAANTLLEEYTKHPHPDRIVIIDLNKADSKTTKCAWYQSANKIGITIPVWPIPHEQMPRWIHDRARRYQLKLSAGATQLLADYVEGNLTAAAQAMEKLYLLNSPIEIDTETIESILSNECHHTVFDLADALISKQPKRAITILSSLQADSVEPTLILWSITRELRLLINLIREHQAGQRYETLFQKHQVFARRQPLYKHFISTTSIETCHRLLQEAAKIDQFIKGALAENPWQAMRLFCLRMV